MSPFPTLARAQKTIAAFSGWSQPEPETGYVWFDAPLDIEGVTEAGFVLHGGAYSNRPEVHVTFEMRISKTPGRRCVPLSRIDWRSLTGGHTNPRWPPPSEWNGRTVSSTHFHDFEINWVPEQGRFRRRQLAREIEEDLQRFEQLRAYTGKHFRINNIEIVDVPPWEYNLFSRGP